MQNLQRLSGCQLLERGIVGLDGRRPGDGSAGRPDRREAGSGRQVDVQAGRRKADAVHQQWTNHQGQAVGGRMVGFGQPVDFDPERHDANRTWRPVTDVSPEIQYWLCEPPSPRLEGASGACQRALADGTTSMHRSQAIPAWGSVGQQLTRASAVRCESSRQSCRSRPTETAQCRPTGFHPANEPPTDNQKA